MEREPHEPCQRPADRDPRRDGAHRAGADRDPPRHPRPPRTGIRGGAHRRRGRARTGTPRDRAPHRRRQDRRGRAPSSGGRPGPTLAIRADMDALPIHEQTGLPFASTIPGKMHACGHDIHTTTLLGVAAVLNEMAPQLAGTVRLLFQPAEEAIGGAARDDRRRRAGRRRSGARLHNSARHADRPLRLSCAAPASPPPTASTSPCAAARATPRSRTTRSIRSSRRAHLITQLQTIVSREVKPLHPVVVTVGAIHAGTAHNIIPDTCTFAARCARCTPRRATSPEAAIRRLCAGAEIAMRVRSRCDYARGVPPMVNDDRVLEPDHRRGAPPARRGDRRGRASHGRRGFRADGRAGAGLPAARRLRHRRAAHDQLHNSGYQPDERCIGLGVQALSRAALEILA